MCGTPMARQKTEYGSGGFVCEGEFPDRAAARSVFAVQFKTEQWCVVFEMDYIGGEPKSDGHENS